MNLKDYKVNKLEVFDQFSNTPHLELIALINKEKIIILNLIQVKLQINLLPGHSQQLGKLAHLHLY